MLKLILLLASLPLVPFALAHSPVPQGTKAGSAADAVRCEVQAANMPGGVRLEGVVISGRALSGTYEFRVSKKGGGGTSTSMQSGEFDAAPGARSVVGEVGLGLGRGASYRAELTVRWRGGETACARQYPDRV